MFSNSATINRKALSIFSSAAVSTSVVTFSQLHNPIKCEDSSNSYYVVQMEEDEEIRNFHETLQHHKRHLNHYKQSWNWHNANSRIPTVSWPLNIPNDSEVPTLAMDLSFCNRRPNEYDSNRRYCNNLQFRIASFMLLQQDLEEQKKGYKIIQNLAEKQLHPDSICAYGTCLNDGRAGIEPNPKAAVSWWKNASDQYDHIQSTYEMGVALYTGEGVAENEQLAVEYFRKAAESGHTGASYMLGDCLLDGVGVERDRGEALEWLVTAAELGHRGARSRVLAVLEKKDREDYGSFTDASRQSLADLDDGSGGDDDDDDDDDANGKQGSIRDGFASGKQRDDKEKPYSGHPVALERRYTIGGGARNPVVLARRKTIVTESRQLE